MKRSNKFFIGIIFLISLSLLMAGCTTTNKGATATPTATPVPAQKTITIVDDIGTTLTVPYPCTRVVFLVENVMNTMYAVGGADNIAGMGSIWKEDLKAPFFRAIDPDFNSTSRISSKNSQVDLEELAAVKPDLVVLWSADWSDANTKAIEETLHVPVYHAYIDNLSDLYLENTNFARIVAKDSNGQALSDKMNATIKKVTDITANIPDSEKPTVYWMWGDVYGCAGLNSTANDLITRSGGVNVISKWDNQSKYLEHPVLSMEAIAALDPDVIYMWYNENLDPEDVLTGDDFKTWSNLKAVKAGRVYELDDPFLYDFHTTRLPITMIKVAKDLHPDKFTSLNLTAETDAYFVSVYGVHYPGYEKA